jgi:GPH family glycoside/pentoside/hexuronide:cation symporter
MTDKSSAPLSLSQLLIFALPGIPLAALTLPLYIVVPTVYSEQYGLSLSVIGFVLLIVRLFDGLTDPVIGWLADRYTGPFGRRRSWFIGSLPFTVVGAWMVFVPPENVTALYLLFWSLFLSLGFTATYLTFSAWGAELSTHYHGRSRISAFREGMIVLGTLLATSAPFIAETFDWNAQDEGMGLLALIIAVLLPLFGFLSFYRTPEPKDRSKNQRLVLKEGLRLLKKNKPFLRLILAFIVNGLANGLPVSLFLYFVSDKLGAEEMRGALLLIYFFCGIVGMPLWIALSRKYSKHRVWCFAMMIACCAFIWAPFLNQGDVALFMIITVITGFCVGADLFLPSSMQADVVDVDTAESGSQRTGLYFALWALATKLALAVAAGIAFPLLDLAGFEASQDQQSDTALWALGILYAFVPVLLKLIATAIMWSYPLDKNTVDELEVRLS